MIDFFFPHKHFFSFTHLFFFILIRALKVCYIYICSYFPLIRPSLFFLSVIYFFDYFLCIMVSLKQIMYRIYHTISLPKYFFTVLTARTNVFCALWPEECKMNSCFRLLYKMRVFSWSAEWGIQSKTWVLSFLRKVIEFSLVL